MTQRENISVFHMFKIGVGPSSSHTLGPWRAAQQFVEKIQSTTGINKVQRVTVHLYGSLAKTGKGHGTDIAVQMGLCADDPVTFDVYAIAGKINSIAHDKTLPLAGVNPITFDPQVHLVYHMDKALPFHPNGVTFEAFDDSQTLSKTYYSINDGFIIQKNILPDNATDENIILKHPIDTAEHLMDYCL